MAKANGKKQNLDENDDFFGDSVPEVGTRFEDREIDGWYEADESIIVAGIIVGTVKIPDDEDDRGFRKAVLIELKRPARAKMDERPIELVPGQVMAVGEKAKLEPLFTYEVGAKVWLRAKGKKKLSGKRSPMWQFDLVIDGKQSSSPAPGPAPF